MKTHNWGEDTVRDDDLISASPTMHSVLKEMMDNPKVKEVLANTKMTNGATFLQEIQAIFSNIKEQQS